MNDSTTNPTMKKQRHQFLPFEEARAFVRTLGIKDANKWKVYSKSGKRPENIPSNPHKTYKNDFQGWGDWLGTDSVSCIIRREFLPFEEARAFVRTLGLKNREEWNAYCKSGKRPENIPSAPMQVYCRAFKGMGDWLGTGTIAPQFRDYLPFEEARAFVRALEIKSHKEWKAYCKSGRKPATIPNVPDYVYHEDFQGWGDWLGTGTIAPFNRDYLPFEEARAFVRALGIKGNKEWHAYSKSGKRPENIPANPNRTYKGDFQGWGDWLGTGTIAPQNRDFLPFEEARAFVHALGLKSQKEWYAYCKSGKRPENIPANPYAIYRGMFRGWGDWLCGVNTKTLIESAVSSELHRRRIAYVEQKRVGKYHADFFIEVLNLTIECDGCYWHGCEKCGFDGHKKREKDRIRDQFFLSKGYRVARLWEHDIIADVKGAVAYALAQQFDELKQVSA